MSKVRQVPLVCHQQSEAKRRANGMDEEPTIQHSEFHAVGWHTWSHSAMLGALSKPAFVVLRCTAWHQQLFEYLADFGLADSANVKHG